MFNIFRKKKPDLLITTSTGELCLPQFTEEDDNCFTVFYCKEAKKLNLAAHYQNVPKEFYPVPVADCNIRVVLYYM
jgi:hypothetical protein